MTATIRFDKDSYAPGETIGFQVLVDQPMTSTITVSGSVELPAGEALPATSTTTISGLYGPFTAPGFVVSQNAADPSRFTAVPS